MIGMIVMLHNKPLKMTSHYSPTPLKQPVTFSWFFLSFPSYNSKEEGDQTDKDQIEGVEGEGVVWGQKRLTNRPTAILFDINSSTDDSAILIYGQQKTKLLPSHPQASWFVHVKAIVRCLV